MKYNYALTEMLDSGSPKTVCFIKSPSNYCFTNLTGWFAIKLFKNSM